MIWGFLIKKNQSTISKSQTCPPQDGKSQYFKNQFFKLFKLPKILSGISFDFFEDSLLPLLRVTLPTASCHFCHCLRPVLPTASAHFVVASGHFVVCFASLWSLLRLTFAHCFGSLCRCFGSLCLCFRPELPLYSPDCHFLRLICHFSGESFKKSVSVYLSQGENFTTLFQKCNPKVPGQGF